MSGKRFTVLVCHPTRQHSHRLAGTLSRLNSLEGYLTLLPTRNSLSYIPRFMDSILPEAIYRNNIVDIPNNLIKVFVGPLIIQRIFSRFKNPFLKDLAELIAWETFDFWVSKQLIKRRPSVILGYEMCCVETFREAKKYGILCVLDAAACHFKWMDEVLSISPSVKNSFGGKRLRQRKAEEVELADLIICNSNLAKASYVDAGVPNKKILVVPLGCDLSASGAFRESSQSTSMRFIFVGQAEYHKGFDILLKAFDRILNDFPDSELIVVGSGNMLGEAKKMKAVKCEGQLSAERVRLGFKGADCLVLPSRCDSFGMVVSEGLSSGLPVIVSENAGAAELIQPGKNGWIVRAGDDVDLYDKMKYCCENVVAVRTMYGECLATAGLKNWNQYGFEVYEAIKTFKDER